jgi:hypothetical protein
LANNGVVVSKKQPKHTTPPNVSSIFDQDAASPASVPWFHGTELALIAVEHNIDRTVNADLFPPSFDQEFARFVKRIEM